MNLVANMVGPQGYGAYEVDWAEPSFRRVERSSPHTLIPGFVDIHIHGAFGLDFMTGSPHDIRVMAEKLVSEGYEGFLPTTVTAPVEAIKTALKHLPDHPAILGFHLEGPFISTKYPGAQPAPFILNPPTESSEWDEIFDDPRLKVITLAPELPGALELTMRLMKRGVRVSMGHTNATFEEARRGFEFGATQTTHTYNAMRPLHHREAGTVGYALATDGLMTELIYDRVHVSTEAARLLVKCKPIDQIIAVSDGTMAAGMPTGTTFEMWGLRCTKGKADVRLDDGTLAGSAITLLDAFRNLRDDFGPELAIHACCLNPRRTLSLGKPQVYVLLNRAGQVEDRFVRSEA